MRVNLIRPTGRTGGIVRYCDELERCLAGSVDFTHGRVTAAALGGIPLLRHLPLSVRNVDPTAPLHFAQVNGLGVLWFQRLPATLVTVHDLGFLVWPAERASFTLVARLLLRLSFAAIQRASLVLAVSESTRVSLVERLGLPGERVVVTPEGVDHSVFRPRPGARVRVEERWGIGQWDSWLTLVAVGSELPRKNVRALLEVIRLFRDAGRHVRLIKIGPAGGADHRRRTLAHIRQADVGERVLLLDEVAEDALADLYCAADAYVCASHLEGFSLPTLEALACGVPVVVAATPALVELVGAAGCVLRGAEPAAWLSQIEHELDDSTRSQRMRELGRERAAAYSWEAMASDTLRHYAAIGR